MTRMNIVVGIRRVPDTEARIAIASDGRSIDPAGVKFILNPYDEFAVEEALRLKESAGTGTVTVVTLGDEASKETLRTALAMGADRAVLLRGTPSVDGLGTAEALARFLRDRSPDLVLFGKQAIDDDNMQVPAMVATLLDWPCVTVVVGLERGDGTWRARREVEGGHEVVEFELPAVVSVQKGLNEPRYPSLKGIMAAKTKPLEELDAGAVRSRCEMVRLEPPPERRGGVIVGAGPDAVPELVRRLREEAHVL
jgi:electron transfer flavoprotein beta subunit